jgi:hypothetical protein
MDPQIRIFEDIVILTTLYYIKRPHMATQTNMALLLDLVNIFIS